MRDTKKPISGDLPNLTGVVVTKDNGIMSPEKYRVFNAVNRIERDKGRK